MTNLAPYADPEVRRQSIGSSDIGVILGVNPFKSIVQLYLEKRGELIPQDESEPMYWGIDLEANVCKRYQHITGNKVARVNKTQRLKGYDYLTSHIDRRVVGQSKILEAKCVGIWSGKGFGDAGTDDLPEHILAQVQWQMGVNDMDAADVAALFGAQWAMRIFPVERDKELFATMLEAAIEFWSRVQEGRPPEPESEADCKALWPAAKRSVVVVGDSLGLARDRYKKSAKDHKSAKLELQLAIGDYEEMHDEIGARIATYKNQPDTRLDQAAFKKAEPEMFKRFTRTKQIRKLLIKERKDG